MSIVIKALNEEKRIVAAVESALTAVRMVGGEVVLADSCSSDRTVALASAYPIRIVQLARADERCCGVGPQLGYQHSVGEFVYILDGDMEMLPGFLPEALAFMQARPDVAGVGGQVVEMNTSSLEYVARVSGVWATCGRAWWTGWTWAACTAGPQCSKPGIFQTATCTAMRSLTWPCACMPGAGNCGAWASIPCGTMATMRLPTSCWCAAGAAVTSAAWAKCCAAWGESHLGLVLTRVRELRLYVAVLDGGPCCSPFWWPPLPWTARIAAFSCIAALPILLMAWRKRSTTKAVFSVVSWCFNAAGLVRGLLTPQRPARAAIDSVEIRNTPGAV